MSSTPPPPDLTALRTAIGQRRAADAVIRTNLPGLVGKFVRTRVPTDPDPDAVYKAFVIEVDVASLTITATSGGWSGTLSATDDLIDLVTAAFQLGKE